VPSPDETFIVRVRRSEGDAIVEEPRSSRRRRIADVSAVGALILRWLGQSPPSAESPEDSGQPEEDDVARPKRR
jgi:hypothetical protein